MNCVTFFSAKNNQISASINNIKLHSAYNPEVEAERFVQNIKIDFFPSQIFVIEPCLSYISKFLNERFPKIPKIALRFSHDFDSYNSAWDKILYFENENKFKLELSNFSEIQICSTLFLQWEVTKKIFSSQSEKIWKIIKEKIEFSKTVLITQNYFSKRWFSNKINFSKYAKNICKIDSGTQDILITASGFSLENAISKIKEIRNSVFLISLSSSLECLLQNQIIPDLVLSTDGGFYAKKHLESLEKQNIPLALALEGNCSKKILEKNPIIPLCYPKDFQNELDFQKAFNIPSIQIERNGTVSGTAVLFALKLTKNNIFFCGLDLSSSPSFQHARKNKLEIENSLSENKLNPLQTRLTKQMFNDYSLKIYENWFIENSTYFENRVFRLSNNYKYKNNLNFIKDINFEEAKKILTKNYKKIEIKSSEYKKVENFKQIYEKYFAEIQNDLEISKIFFPLDYLKVIKSVSAEEKQKNQQKLNDKIKNLINSAEKLLK